VTIFGSLLGPIEGVNCGLDANQRALTSCGGTRVIVDGVAAPLFYVRADQVNAQIPYEIAGRTGARVQISSDSCTSSEFSVKVEPSDPGIFTYPPPDNRAVALNQNGTLNSRDNPAARGDVIILYATGEGQTMPPGVTGQLCAPPNLAMPLLPCSAYIGGEPAPKEYCGCAPKFAGLLQLNVRIPQSVSAGAVPIAITLGNNSSQPGVVVWVH
jgi:uncharacterized protein (TIGR03437 family)